jgi:tetratricopeptide (TPR) repeat protein
VAVYRAVANINLDQNEEVSIAALEKVVSEDRENRTALVNLGEHYLGNGDYAKALDIFDALIGIEETPYYYMSRGWAYNQLNAVSQARKDYGRANELNPDYPYSYYYMGCSYYDEDDIMTALPFVEKTQELDPDHRYSVFFLIQLYARIGEIAKAEALVADRINRTEGRDDAYVMQINEEMIDLYFHNGLYEKALTLKDKVLDEDGKTKKAVIYMILANCEYELWHDDVSEGLYNKALELTPEDGTILENYAYFIYVVKKDYAAAAAFYEKAFKTNDSIHNLIWLGKSCWMAGNKGTAKLNFNMAITRIKRELKSNGGRTACHCNQLGECYHWLGKTAKAEKYLLEAMKLAEGWIDCNKRCCYEAAFTLGLIYRGTGDLNKARKYYDIVIQTKPDREYKEAGAYILG